MLYVVSVILNLSDVKIKCQRMWIRVIQNDIQIFTQVLFKPLCFSALHMIKCI